MISDTLIILFIFIVFSIPSAICDAIKLRFPVILPILGFFSVLGFDIFSQTNLIWPLISAAVISLILFLARLFTSGSLGKGDIIFGSFMGICCSLPESLYALLLSSVLGIIYYIFIRTLNKKKAQQTAVYRPIFAIPYVPFLTAGTIITLLSIIL